jgi:hypothetical protein
MKVSNNSFQYLNFTNTSEKAPKQSDKLLETIAPNPDLNPTDESRGQNEQDQAAKSESAEFRSAAHESLIRGAVEQKYIKGKGTSETNKSTNERDLTTISEPKIEISPESPRPDRIEALNEIRTILEGNVGKLGDKEMLNDLNQRISEIKERIDALESLSEKIRTIEEKIDEWFNKLQTSGEPVNSQSMEFYQKVRDALEAAMGLREAQ